MRAAQRIGESALPLRSPHDAVEIPGARIVFDQAEEEVAIAGIVEAEGVGVAAVQVLLLGLRDVGTSARKTSSNQAMFFMPRLREAGSTDSKTSKLPRSGARRFLSGVSR